MAGTGKGGNDKNRQTRRTHDSYARGHEVIARFTPKRLYLRWCVLNSLPFNRILKMLGSGLLVDDGSFTIAKKMADHRAVLVFSAAIAKELDSEQVRLPPNYIGVRRVRPSNHVVRDELRSNNDADATTCNLTAPVVYKITDSNGVERRMNKQEKKALRNRLRQEKAEARKKQKLDTANAHGSSQNDTALDDASVHSSLSATLKDAPAESKSNYHQLEVSASALDEELADLRGDRDGVPPVMLSSPMAIQAIRTGVLPTSGSSAQGDVCLPSPILDDNLGSRWATELKESMKRSEEIRSKERMRPMAYQLKPEVWTRLRPESLSDASSRDITRSKINNAQQQDQSHGDDEEHTQRTEAIAKTAGTASGAAPPSSIWSYVAIRQRYEPYDSDTAHILTILHRHSLLHVSCGAKFGCDFLLYDGCRDKRHAFAGLRVIEKTKSKLPLPSSYDMAGYVRCLNTAGKLALLATVEYDESSVRVAFVDLALEKILSETQQQSRKTTKARREMGKNLAKHR